MGRMSGVFRPDRMWATVAVCVALAGAAGCQSARDGVQARAPYYQSPSSQSPGMNSNRATPPRPSVLRPTSHRQASEPRRSTNEQRRLFFEPPRAFDQPRRDVEPRRPMFDRNEPLPPLIPARTGAAFPAGPAPKREQSTDGGSDADNPQNDNRQNETAPARPGGKPADASDDDKHPSRWKKKLKAHYA